MPALSQNLEFIINNTGTVNVVYPNTGTTTLVYNSIPVKGDGYYGSADGLHTVTYTLDPNFIGTVTMQASLATMPGDSDWFNVKDTASVYTVFDDRSFGTVDYYNFTGNFVWVRGQISFTAGSVQAVSFNH
jgi:hypothetical protein